jgi:hypothetical protein
MAADFERQKIGETPASSVSGGSRSRMAQAPPLAAPSSTPIIQNVHSIRFGRKFVLLAIFLLSLPYFASMPVMHGTRLTHGKFADAASIPVVMGPRQICGASPNLIAVPGPTYFRG